MAVTPSVCVLGSEPGTATVVYSDIVGGGTYDEGPRYILPEGSEFIGAVPVELIFPVPSTLDLRELRNRSEIVPIAEGGTTRVIWLAIIDGAFWIVSDDGNPSALGASGILGLDFIEASEVTAIVGLPEDVGTTIGEPLTGELRATFSYAGNESYCSSFDGEEPEVPGPCDLLPSTPSPSIVDTWPSAGSGYAYTDLTNIGNSPFPKNNTEWQVVPAAMNGAAALGFPTPQIMPPKLNNLWISVEKFAEYLGAVPNNELYDYICTQYGVDGADTEVYISAYSTTFYQSAEPLFLSIWGQFGDVPLEERRGKHFMLRKASYEADYTYTDGPVGDITVYRNGVTYTAPFTLDPVQTYTPTAYSYVNRAAISLLNDSIDFEAMYTTLDGDFSLKTKDDYVLMRTLGPGLTGWTFGQWSQSNLFHSWRAKWIIDNALEGPVPLGTIVPSFTTVENELVLKEFVNPIETYVYEVNYDPAVEGPQTVGIYLTGAEPSLSNLGTFLTREYQGVPDLPFNEAGDTFRYYVEWEGMQTVPYCHTTYDETNAFSRDVNIVAGGGVDARGTAGLSAGPLYVPSRSIGVGLSASNAGPGYRYGLSPLTVFPSEDSPYGVSLPPVLGNKFSTNSLPRLRVGTDHWAGGPQLTKLTYPFMARLVIHVYNHTQYLNTVPDPLPTVNLTDEGEAGFAALLRGVDANKVMNNLNQVLTGYLPFLVDRAEGQARQRPLDMNGLKVTNLGPGESGDDAITVSQLQGLL